MKKSLLFISVLLIGATNSFSQTIPNAGFETWTGASPDEPVSWGTGDAIDVQLNGLVTKATAAGDINSGSSAIILTTVQVSCPACTYKTWFVAGTAISGGQINSTYPFQTGGIPYTSRPTYLNGFCKYIPQHKGTPIDTVDVSNIQVYFFKWNVATNRRDTIGQGQLSPTNNTFAAFSVPIWFTTAASPDTAQIILASSKGIETSQGSKLYVDDIAFAFTPQPPCQITLSSVAGTDAQSVCKNTAIAGITYTVTGMGASVAGLPTGVTSAFAAGVITISGTPSVAGTFNYTVSTTGGCSPDASASGTITVNQTTISLTSAVVTAAQTIAPNTAITNITYLIGGTATGATVSPTGTGISGIYNAGVFTVSGTPSTLTAGQHTYTITTTGGLCTQKSGIFMIRVMSCNPDPLIPTTGTTPSILPDTTPVMIQTPGGTFNQTFTIYVPTAAVFTLMGFTINANLDSVRIQPMTGLPTGFVTTCGTPNCIVPAGQVGCFTVSGTMPMTDNILYHFGVSTNPYGTLTGPAATAVPGGPSIQGALTTNNVAVPPLASYKVQVGTPPPPTGVQSFDINQFNVTQNKPNPFDVSTVINFNCPVSSKVDFVVVDILGRQVYNTNINATAGANTFTFSSDLASGTYFFSISNGINTITRKMVVAGQ